jgi:hypothetical protein
VDAGLTALLPTGGVAAVLAAVIFYLLRANLADRRDYREAVRAAQERFQGEVNAHRVTEAMLDAQRELRREAEDRAARATIAAEQNNQEIQALRREVEQLHRKVTG